VNKKKKGRADNEIEKKKRKTQMPVGWKKTWRGSLQARKKGEKILAVFPARGASRVPPPWGKKGGCEMATAERESDN